MDNVTHTLVGLTLARTRLGRAGRGTTMALVLASNAPDIDIVTISGGAANYLHWHRSYTHGPFGVIGLGFLTAAIVVGGRMFFDKRSNEPSPPYLKLALICMAGIVIHVLMDLPTSYGTRPLAPFSWRWYSEDWLPIVDIYMLAILAAGLLFGRGSELARSQNVKIVAVLLLLNYGVRGMAHHEAIALAPRVFGPTLPTPCVGAPDARAPIESWPRPPAVTPGDSSRRCLVDLAATPEVLSPFSWRLIAQTSNSYETFTVDLTDRRYHAPPEEGEVPWRRVVRYPNAWTPAVFASAAAPMTHLFLGFSRFPLARTSTRPGSAETLVRWSDMRFAPERGQAPPGARGVDRGISASAGALFGVSDDVDAGGQVTREVFGR